MRFTNVDYDNNTHEFTLRVVVMVPRTKNALWPIVARVKEVSSALGSVSVVNADNGLDAVGAAWTIDGPGQPLADTSAAALEMAIPSGKEFVASAPRRIRLRLKNAHADPVTIAREILENHVELAILNEEDHRTQLEKNFANTT